MEGQRDEASQSWAPEVLLTAQSPCLDWALGIRNVADGLALEPLHRVMVAACGHILSLVVVSINGNGNSG